jgi:hypothetical protein
MDCCSGVSVLPTDPMLEVTRFKQLDRARLRLKRRSLIVVRLSCRTKGWQRITVAVARIKRRRFVQGLAGAAIAVGVNSCRSGEPPSSQSETEPTSKSASKSLKKVNMGFCSYLICAIPFEVARKHGFFAEEGLEIDLIYLRGGAAPIQAIASELGGLIVKMGEVCYLDGAEIPANLQQTAIANQHMQEFYNQKNLLFVN